MCYHSKTMLYNTVVSIYTTYSNINPYPAKVEKMVSS